ncbi:MAG: hypothetical protein D6755_05720 [Anaerolineae bacterium]|nr:MAG: hypothetical protein D6755_05720 [Anaerolineae bacterium]
MSKPENQPVPSVVSVLPTAFFLTVPGCAGLFWVVTQTLPTLWPRWLFFFWLTITGSGITLPFVTLLNRRFGGTSPVSHGILLRQSLWGGLYLATLAWLQLGRVLTPSVMLLLAAGFFLIEFLLRVRERSRWQPPTP